MRRVIVNPVIGAVGLCVLIAILIVLLASPVGTSSANSHWITTTNAELGYSISRPPASSATYYLPEQILNIELLPGPVVLSIRAVANPELLTSAAWAEKHLLDPKLRGTSPLAPPLPTAERNQITIGGRPAETFLVHGPVVSIQRTVVAREDQVFLLDHQTYDGELNNILKQIVASFEVGEFKATEGLVESMPELSEDIPELPVPHYSQKDPRWICDQIGSCWCYLGNCFGHTGIGDAGCYITAESMIFDYYTGGFMDPQELDTCLTNNGGYGLWQGCGWGLCATTYDPIEACSPSVVTYEGLSGVRSTLDSDLQNGYPAIAWVDGGVHYLVITGKENGKYLVNDPLYARTSIYSGEIIYFVRLHGPLPSEPALDSTFQSGFPSAAYRTPDNSFPDAFKHVLVANLDDDPTLEIAATALGTGPLYVWDADGAVAPDWPQGINLGQAFPAAGKLTDSQLVSTIVAGFGNGMVQGFHSDGSGLSGWPESIIPAGVPPSLADVDGDGIEDVFIPTGDSQLAGFKADGSALAGWPVAGTPGQLFATPAIADLDKNGSLEVISVLGSNGGSLSLYAFSADGQLLAGFPIPISGTHMTVPAVGDVDGDFQNEIVIAGSNAPVQIYSTSGQLERTMSPQGSVNHSTAPALADLDGDSFPEIIVQANTSLNVWKGDGTVFPGWPESWGSEFTTAGSTPVAGDVDGDGIADIVITIQAADQSGEDQLRIYNRQAGIVEGGLKTLHLGPGAVPAIADIDLDDRNEIIVLSAADAPEPGFAEKLHVFDLGGGPHGAIEWGQFGGGPQHRGLYPAPPPPQPLDIPPAENGTMFLPIMRVNASPEPATIHGNLKLNGSPLGNIPVTLRYFDGQDWRDWITLATTPGGNYSFVSPPGLSPGEKYMVRFTNSDNHPDLVTQWDSRPITIYHEGEVAGLSPVDLADLALTSPAPSSTTALPAAFSWTRPAGLSEFLYQWVLYDPEDGSPLYQSPLLEDQLSFSLGSLPAGFDYNQPYSWTVWIYGPDGSQLFPGETRTITFLP